MMKRIAITNMTGGRNRGCEALVSSILLGLADAVDRKDLHISLHTGDEQYDRPQFGERIDQTFPLSGIPRAGWSPGRQTMAYRAAAALNQYLPGNRRFGRAQRDLLAADLIIGTGGDVFTSDYWDFTAHARVLHVGKPVALLAQTIGPFTKQAEEYFKNSTKNISICTVRETESLEYLKKITPDINPQLTADVAFLLPVTPPEEARYILEMEHRFPTQGRRLIALSVSGGILAFRSDVEPDKYLREIAAFIDGLNRDGFSVVLVPHVQERDRRNNDLYACREVLKRCSNPLENVILSLPLSASDFKGVIGLCEALIGARTHATIASMSQGIPTVSIAYSRKAWGIMRDYFGHALGTTLTIDVAELNRERMADALKAALANGPTLEIAAEMKRRATVNFQQIKGFLDALPSN
jgi:colanic acid/amylovoran biosynthesis protein